MSILVPSEGLAQADPRVTKSMETLKSTTAKLGASKCAKTRRQRPSSWQFWQDRRSSRSKQAKHTTAKCQFWERPIRAMNQQGKFRHSNWRLLCGLQEVTIAHSNNFVAQKCRAQPNLACREAFSSLRKLPSHRPADPGAK